MDACDDDVRLMLAFREGDESAFDRLFERWAGRLLRFLERMVRDSAVAEELVQETFLRVHRGRSSYRPDARFSTWLYTIATNAARNELRRPFRRSPHESADAPRGPTGEDPPLALPDASASPEDVAHARRLGDDVDEALAALPERQRTALWLSAVEGLSYAEVARALDTTDKGVKALVHRARAALAERFGEEPAAAAPRARGERR